MTQLPEGIIHKGPVEIRAFLEGQPPKWRGLHVTVNPKIVIKGEEATVRADFYILVPRSGASVVGAWGRYRDRMVRQGGRWLFAERGIDTQFVVSEG
jgi:hypothetical protein